MFITDLEEKYGSNVPIFTSEILSLFPQYTKAYVFRLINVSVNDGSLSKFDNGVYYISQVTPFGPSTITATDVVRKKYIQFGGDIYGLYSGITLQNEFSATSQVANTPEIVTNRESTRCRKIYIDGMPFILRKSRTEITNQNADAYCILQLFTEKNGVKINSDVRREVLSFIQSKKISREALLELAQFFPATTLNSLIYNEVI